MKASLWSVSKHTFMEMDSYHGAHLLAAFKKLERGEYGVPADPDDPLVLRPLTSDEDAELRVAFDAEFQKRGIGPYAPAEPGEVGRE